MYECVGQNFINMIKSVYPAAKIAAGGSELVVRCMLCGDSKNLRHAHMYLKVPMSNSEISLYHCKKCNSQGIVDDEFLRKLGCYDPNVLVAVAKHNAEVFKLPQYKQMKAVDIYPLRYPQIEDNKFNRLKLKYINERIGSNFNYNDLIRLKIFVNLLDVIGLNRLELTRVEDICRQLTTHFIGFISYDNSFAIMRRVFNNNLIKNINLRYVNYNIIPKQDDSKRFYIIPTTIDILNPTPVNIHIAEGVFDILSIYYNLNNCNNSQNIYIVSGGKSYYQALEFILKETGLINYIIHLYPDNDVNNYELNRLIKFRINKLPTTIIVHRNVYKGEKDYGVPKSHIKDSVIVYE